MEGTIGEIRMFGGNFAPRSWQFCNGGLLSISVYTALYSVIGTTYGGDGQTTFAVPDLRGRIPVGTGQGNGLPNWELGQVQGTETVTLTTAQMATHTHATTMSYALPAYSESGTLTNPNNAYIAGLTNAYTSEQNDTTLKPFTSPITLAVTGGSAPFSIMQPYLAVNYIMCLEGIFPSRN